MLLRWWPSPENLGAVFGAAGILAVSVGTLIFWTGIADAYQLPKLWFFALGGFLMWMGAGKTPRTALDSPLTALFSIMTISSVFSVEIAHSLFGVYRASFYGLLPVAVCASLYYASAYSKNEPLLVLRLILAAVVLNALYANLQPWGLDPFISWGFEDMRSFGATASPVYLGSLIVAVVPVAAHLFRWPKTVLPWAVALVLISALWWTKSRGAWLGSAAAVGAYLFVTGHLGRKKLLAAVFLLACAGVLGVRDRGMSDGLRTETWKIAWTAFKKAPIIGHGPGTFPVSFRRYRTDRYMEIADGVHQQASAHNDVLQALSTIGIVGTAIYLWLLVVLAMSVKTLHRWDPELAGVIGGAFFGIFVLAKFNPVPLATMGVLAVFAGVLAGRSPGYSLNRRVWGIRASALLLAIVTVVCFADMRFKDAIMASRSATFGQTVIYFETATRWNPWNVRYKTKYVQYLHAAVEGTNQWEELYLLTKAVHVSEDAVLRLPGSIEAYEVLGVSRMLLRSRSNVGTFQRAMDALDIAQMMDPNFLHTMKIRQAIAKAMRDKSKFESIGRERHRLEKLMEAD